MNRILAIILSLVSITLFAQPAPKEAVEKKAIPTYQTVAPAIAKTITKEDLKTHLTIVASDDFEGRETATAGQRKAADYIKNQLVKLGYPALTREGVVDGYFQNMPFSKQRWGTVTFNARGKSYKHLRDFYCFRRSNVEMPLTKLDEVVFLGYGIDESIYSDYKGVDVKGKVIMILQGEPTNKKGISHITKKLTKSSWATNWRKKVRAAKDHGVKAVLMIDPEVLKNINKYRKWLVESSLKMGLPEVEEDLPMANHFYISPQMAKDILGKKAKKLKKARKKIKKKGKPKNFTVPVNIEMQQTKESEIIYSSNVMGFMEGSDENLKNEIVTITAHYDHLGTRGDDVYNGADDNGTGTTALLEMAEAYAKAKADGNGPRRSVLMMWVSGEEKGLLGSKYYVENPVFPLENTIVNVNVDMIGRVDEKHEDNPKYIYVIGADRLSSELHEINEAANKKHTQVDLDYTFNAEDDPNQFYYRSDHYNFAEKGIPAIFYFSGVHKDYHKITDTVDKIMFGKMESIARLIFHTSWELANRDKRIVVDKSDKK